MERSLLIECVKEAVGSLYRLDKHLINVEAHELSIASKIACYLQHLLKENLHVDIDYSRVGNEVESKRGTDGSLIRPDIIIHGRGPEGPNLATLEIKGHWNRQDRKDDEAVLLEMISKYSYDVAFRIELLQNEFEIFIATKGEPNFVLIYKGPPSISERSGA